MNVQEDKAQSVCSVVYLSDTVRSITINQIDIDIIFGCNKSALSQGDNIVTINKIQSSDPRNDHMSSDSSNGAVPCSKFQGAPREVYKSLQTNSSLPLLRFPIIAPGLHYLIWSQSLNNLAHPQHSRNDSFRVFKAQHYASAHRERGEVLLQHLALAVLACCSDGETDPE